MSDLIRRQDAIELIENESRKWGEEYGVSDVLCDLADLPSAQPEQRWTPISERLPKEKINPNTLDFEEVLCSTTFGDVRAYKFGTPLGWKEPHFWNGPGMMDEYVSHGCRYQNRGKGKMNEHSN